MSNYLSKPLLFLLFLLFIGFLSCKEQLPNKITHYTSESTGHPSSENSDWLPMKKHPSNKTSYYAGGRGKCSGSIRYQFGWVTINSGYSDELVQEFRLLIRQKLQALLNSDVEGSFLVHNYLSEIRFSEVFVVDNLPIQQKIQTAFAEAAYEKHMSVQIDPTIIVTYYDTICNSLPTIPPNPPNSGGAQGSYNTTVFENTFSFFPDVPCATVQAWLLLAKYKCTPEIINKLNLVVIPGQAVTVERVARIQKIDDAYSTVVNMDYFPIRITTMPTINGHLYTAAEFLHYMRVNLNTFTGPGKIFNAYQANGVDDRALWNSSDPRGAILALDLGGPDNGSVITSFSRSDKWTFTTIYEPKYGEHPVSGNRDFGYTPNNNGIVIYTRGVDRLTSWDATFFQNVAGIPFQASDNLWTLFQSRLAGFVNSHGGNATPLAPEIKRPNWDVVKKVMSGELPMSTLSKRCP